MKIRAAVKAMMVGSVASIMIFLVLLVIASFSLAIEESFIGRLIWEFPVPMDFVEEITTVLFGAHTDERGLVVILVAVGVEVALIGAVIGIITQFASDHKRQSQRFKMR